MDWQQLHKVFHSHQRIETLIHFLNVAERRQRRRLLVRGIIRRERHPRRQRVHFRDDNHDTRRRRLVIFMRAVFIFIMLTLSIATGLIVFHIHPRYAAPLLFVYQLLILVLILFKPRKRQRIRSV